MKALLSVTLLASLLGCAGASAQTGSEQQLPNSGTFSQNSSGSGDNVTVGAQAHAAPGAHPDAATPPAATHRWLIDAKSECAASVIEGIPADAITWSGRCVAGEASGPGTLTFLSQTRFVESLTGDFDRGALHAGHATLKWANGSSYDGDVAGVHMEGKGVLTNEAGDRFEGQWSADKLNGHGVATWANGDRYDGEWRNGKASGHGVQVWADGRKYDGDWQNDLPNGQGIATRKDGSRLAGTFADGQPENTKELAMATDAAPPHATPAVETEAKPAVAADAPSAQGAPAKGDSVMPAELSSFNQIAGKKYFAVDGSWLSLTMDDEGLTREIVAPNGSAKKSVFSFLSDKLGSVSDGGDEDKVMGVFRLTDRGIATEYSDGRTELLVANNAGGVSMVLNTPGGDRFCMAWYPEGHHFSVEEREAALAVYANQLGLNAPASASHQKAHKPAPKPSCVADTEAGVPVAAPAPSVSTPDAAAPPPAGPLPRPASHRAASTRATTLPASFIAPMPPGESRTVDVRPSAVHAIDAGADSKALPPPAAQPQTLASNPPPPAGLNGAGASKCLSIESDGQHWDFRNHCGYDVQFAYCLMNADNPLVSCSKGAISGSVSPDSASALIADKSLGETNGDHDFRWVACGGGAGEVVVHLDQTDPPVGRCVRPGAS